MPENYSEQNQMVFSLLAIAALIFSAIIYARIGTANHGYLDETYSDINGSLNSKVNTENEKKNVSFKEKVTFPPQPSCPLEDKHIQLNMLCTQFIFEKYNCKPEDVLNPLKHKIPKFYYQNSLKNNSNNDTQNTIVNFIIAALLLTSLGAALLEFYRAKIVPRTDDKKGNKGNLSRKCSLADLTVLKHHRKELIRRESVLEQHPEEPGSHGSSQQGRRNSSRPQLRLD
ncbi:uncharacterized protein LOC126737789 isoform X2 [Anthonomus grandis grandis]|uniref:uncharacterized protein LOC126737789 isoform X2 n=1 Tax=Anthonomus grandis grandis TaxID=2921223 RepID=UPI002166AE70|nr:uncharacterized protein LOC126737789 isoform X2 [Anthonomus grandis grandis]XP_050298795.1 uncharacterized protein LOC126737789 isoform X2 [Anthonomus grandis grandis]